MARDRLHFLLRRSVYRFSIAAGLRAENVVGNARNYYPLLAIKLKCYKFNKASIVK